MKNEINIKHLFNSNIYNIKHQKGQVIQTSNKGQVETT